MIGALAWAAGAWAVTRDVTVAADTNDGVAPWSLREALTASAPGDVVTFSTWGAWTVVSLNPALGALPARPGVEVKGLQRVVIDAAALGAGVRAIALGTGEKLWGVHVRGAPGVCVEITGSGAVVGGSGSSRVWVTGCGRSGVLVNTGGGGARIENVVVGSTPTNALSAVCTTPSGACAGIDVRTTGNGVEVLSSFVSATLGSASASRGIGIQVARTSGARVAGNVIGATPSGWQAGAGNLGVGIQVAASSGQSVVSLVVEDNVVLDSGAAGVYVGPRAAGTVVRANRVGVNAAGLVKGNASHGIRVFGSDLHQILDNVVVASGGLGIQLEGNTAGDWQSGSTVSGNRVGAYPSGAGWAIAGNASHGIRSAGSEPGGSVLRNTVVASGGDGVVVAAPDMVVSGNGIGIDPLGVVAHGNAGIGISVTADGDRARIGGFQDWSALPTLTEANVVAASGSNGIEVRGDRTWVLGNLVGTDGFGDGADDAFGSALDGIYVTKANDVNVGGGNVVVNSGDTGIEISESTGTSFAARTEVYSNLVGIDLLDNPVGNTEIGIRARHAGTVGGLVRDNHVVGNYLGIYLDATDSVVLRRNSVHDNTTCGVRLNAANRVGGVALPAPALNAAVTGAGLTGFVAAPPAGATLTSIDVFVDAGTEHERFLGGATFQLLGGTWVWSLLPQGYKIPPPADLDLVRISAIATYDVAGGSPRSADPGGFCGDGCAAAGGCPLGDTCNAYTCASGVCQAPAPRVGAACLDGDGCDDNACNAAGQCAFAGAVACQCLDSDPAVGILADTACDDGDLCTVDGCAAGGCEHVPVDCDDHNDCTADFCDGAGGCQHTPRAAGFTCEDGDRCTGAGTCDGAGHCSSGAYYGCPHERCNGLAGRQIVWGCDPLEGCVVVSGAGTADGQCDLWDLCPYGGAACPGGTTCDGNPADCQEGDTDFDGIPDDWEQPNGWIDLDCDGTVSAAEEATGIALDLVVDVRDVLVHVDRMAPSGGHDHDLDTDPLGDEIGPVIDSFARAATYDPFRPFRLHVDLGATIPHREVTTFDRAPTDPACTDWTGLSRWKMDPTNFPAWKQGLFHYAINGHRRDTCTETSTGRAELGGDDFIVAMQADMDPIRTRGTFMHEIGHNFGFRHGGPVDLPTRSVNLLSVMSYRHQFRNLVLDPTGDYRDPADTTLVPDYAHQALTDLDEAAVVEPDGILNFDPLQSPAYAVVWDWPSGKLGVSSPERPFINWNGTGGIEPGAVAWDLDGNPFHPQLHQGRDEWGELELRFRCAPEGEIGAGASGPSAELTPAEAQASGEYHPLHVARMDVLRGCTANPVPATGAGWVQVVLFGDADFEAGDLFTVGGDVFLEGAPALARAREDVDADGFDDLVVEFAAAAMANRGATAELALEAQEPSTRRVVAFDDVTWTPTTDPDGDHVPSQSACDVCPAVPAPIPAVDGCP